MNTKHRTLSLVVSAAVVLMSMPLVSSAEVPSGGSGVISEAVTTNKILDKKSKKTSGNHPKATANGDVP